MRPAMIGFLVFIFVVAGFLSSMYTGSAVLASDQDNIAQLTNIQQVSSQQPWGIFNIVTLPVRYIAAIFTIMSSTFVFMSGYAVWFTWIAMSPIYAIVCCENPFFSVSLT